jgi:cysteinyl-tRNA synthetase
LYLLGFKFNLSSYSFADKLLIGQWQTARQEKKYLLADAIRKSLQAKNILL